MGYTRKVLSLEMVEGVAITAQDSGEVLSGVQRSSMLREGGSSTERSLPASPEKPGAHCMSRGELGSLSFAK